METMRWNRVVAITGDCKSPAFRLRRFESYFQHQSKIPSFSGGILLWYGIEVREPTKPFALAKVRRVRCSEAKFWKSLLLPE